MEISVALDNDEEQTKHFFKKMISPVCCVGLNGVSQPLVGVHLPCIPIETPCKQDAVQEHHPILKMHQVCVICIV